MPCFRCIASGLSTLPEEVQLLAAISRCIVVTSCSCCSNCMARFVSSSVSLVSFVVLICEYLRKTAFSFRLKRVVWKRSLVTGCIEQEGRSLVDSERLKDGTRLNDACRKDEQDGGCWLVNSGTQCREATAFCHATLWDRTPLGWPSARRDNGVPQHTNFHQACLSPWTIRFSMPFRPSRRH